MLKDLAALTPPLVVCVAFLIGLGLFMRHQLGPKRRPSEDESGDDISGATGIRHSTGSDSAASGDLGDDQRRI
ncbi:MAG TPA: hypothetical protein VG253_27780 [Streptosporangiaceae bacterium]|jgi:hypothetical protein|nr:hypothetical protein [Streptosporangiaceae bacterium]